MRHRVQARAFFVLLALSVAALGCNRGASAGGSGRMVVERDTVGDTVVVRTVSGSLWGSERTLVPEISIGEESGDSTYLFGQISALAVAPDGTIYVLDRQAMVIRAYGPDGKYIRTLGRRGSGPGELKQPQSMLVLSDGRVVACDPGNRRIQVYRPDGEPGGAWALSENAIFGVVRFWRDTLDDVYAPYNERVEGGGPSVRYKPGVVRIGPDGTHGDTLMFPETGFKPISVRTERTDNSGRVTSAFSFVLPYTPRESWAMEPAGYLVHAISSDYRIDILRTHAPVLRIERTWTPVPVTAAERASRKESLERIARRVVPGWKWNGPDIPDQKSPFSTLYVGRHGRIWVLVSTPSVERDNPDHDPKNPSSTPTVWTHPTAFDVFRPDGTYLGRVGAPDDLYPYPSPAFDGDHVWAVTRDSMEVERVARYRVVADRTGG